MERPDTGWDKRAWLVGTLGGLAGGLVTGWASYPPLARRINAATHFASGADWVSGIAAGLAALVLPGLVSGLARRWTFLWGALPLALFLAAVDAEDAVESGLRHVAHDFWVSLLVAGICLVLSSGPVSLVRFLRARTRRRQAAAQAALQAQREAAAVQQEGVWPPPPDFML